MATHSKRNSLPSLWEQAVQLWRDLTLGFGHSHDLMRWGWMRALYHRALGRELRDLETIVRSAIRADAAELDLPAPKPLARRPKRPPPQSNEDMPRFRRSYGDDSTTWKVSFSMSKREDTRCRKGRRRGPRHTDPEARRPCRGYAFRIEALRRAITCRAGYARRYALRLARIEQARIEDATPGPREEFLAELSALFGPPEHDGAGLATFDVEPRSAKLIEPG